MKLCVSAGLILLLFTGTLTQDFGFDLSDALDDVAPTPAKPKELPKAPEKPKDDGGLDLLDALGPGDPPTQKPKKPSSGDSGGGFDLLDALGPETKTNKPPVKPPKSGGGGGNFGDSDLIDVSGTDYKPDGGRSGGGGAVDPGYDPQGGADQPQDPGLLWEQILKMLNANIPEDFYMWMSNFKQTLMSLLERAMDLLQAIP